MSIIEKYTIRKDGRLFIKIKPWVSAEIQGLTFRTIFNVLNRQCKINGQQASNDVFRKKDGSFIVEKQALYELCQNVLFLDRQGFCHVNGQLFISIKGADLATLFPDINHTTLYYHIQKHIRQYPDRANENRSFAIMPTGKFHTIYRLDALYKLFFEEPYTLDAHGRVVIDGIEYQHLDKHRSPDLFNGYNPLTVYKKIYNRRTDVERTKSNILHYRFKNGKKKVLIRLEALKELTYTCPVKVSEAGHIIIDGQHFIRSNHKQGASSLWGFSALTIYLKITKYLSAHPEAKALYQRKIRGVRYTRFVYLESWVKQLLLGDVPLPVVNQANQCMIDGKVYQWIYSDPYRQEELLGLPISARYRLLKRHIKKNPERGSCYRRKALSQSNTLVFVYELEQLKLLVSPKPILESDCTISISGKTYLWVKISTPPSQLWGVKAQTACTKIKEKLDHDPIWKEKHSLKAYHTLCREVTAIEVNALKQLVSEFIDLPIINEHGRTIVDGLAYQQLSASTPPEQLRGVPGTIAYTRLIKKLKDPSKLNLHLIQKGKSPRGRACYIVEVNYLKSLLRGQLGFQDAADPAS